MRWAWVLLLCGCAESYAERDMPRSLVDLDRTVRSLELKVKKLSKSRYIDEFTNVQATDVVPLAGPTDPYLYYYPLYLRNPIKLKQIALAAKVISAGTVTLRAAIYKINNPDAYGNRDVASTTVIPMKLSKITEATNSLSTTSTSYVRHLAIFNEVELDPDAGFYAVALIVTGDLGILGTRDNITHVGWTSGLALSSNTFPTGDNVVFNDYAMPSFLLKSVKSVLLDVGY